MEENANKLHFYHFCLLFIHKFRYFQCL